MKMWRVFGFSEILVPKVGADVIDVSVHCSLTSVCCIVSCDVDACEFGTCPTRVDVVVFAERREEVFSMDLLHVFDTKIIHN